MILTKEKRNDFPPITQEDTKELHQKLKKKSKPKTTERENYTPFKFNYSPDPNGTITLNPFEDSDFEITLKKKEYKKPPTKEKPFPHNLQFTNMHLLEKEHYHKFNGEVAIHLKKVEYLDFKGLLYDKKLNKYHKMGPYLKMMGYRIMYCNPHYTEKQLYDCLAHIFNEFVHIPKSDNLLDSYAHRNEDFAASNYKRIEIGANEVYNDTINLRIPRVNKTIYNPDYDLTPDERTDLGNKLRGGDKRVKNLEKIYQTYINWDYSKGKRIQKNIAKEMGMHRNTLGNYWEELMNKVDPTPTT